MYKNKEVLTKGQIISMKNNKWINFRFIGLLCVAFLLQHFSHATIYKSFTLKNVGSGIIHVENYDKGTSQLPDAQLNVFVEMESEDEDHVQDEHIVCNKFISASKSLELVHYTNGINRLFLKLAATNQHKVDLPFFILYHSWKSELA